MFRMLCALLLGTVVVGCAALGVRTEGVSGPIAWRATDFNVGSVPGDTGIIGRRDREIYAFTLVLQETQGTAITFTKVAYTIAGSVGLKPFSTEETGQWRLRPHGELRWPLSSTYGCASIDCVDPGFVAPVWHITLMGTDDRGQPVRIAIDLRLPYNPRAQPSLNTPDLPSGALAGAKLRKGSLAGAALSRANLQGAELREADLMGAHLSLTDLREADLRKANLRGTNLREVENLTQAQLDTACVDDKAKLSSHLKHPEPCA